MSFKKITIISIVILAVTEIIGLGIYWLLPKRHIAVTELILNSQVVSTSGLAHMELFVPGKGIELQTVHQLLQSRSAAEHAGSQLNVSTEEIMRHTLVREGNGPGTLELRIANEIPETSIQASHLILQKAQKLDQELKEQQVGGLITALRSELAMVEASITSTNQQLEELLKNKKTLFASPQERQQHLSVGLAHFEREIARLKIQDAHLKRSLEASKQSSSEEDDYLNRNPERNSSFALSETRRLLIQRESSLASLQSRYGDQNPQVVAARAERDEIKNHLEMLREAQDENLTLSFSNNTEAMALFEEKISNTLEEFRQKDPSLDPTYLALEMEKQALQQAFSDISKRVLELEIYKSIARPPFNILSPPYISNSLNLKRIAVVIIISGITGVFFSGAMIGILLIIQKNEALG